MCDVDPTFIVEIALFAELHGGKRAKTRMQALVMEALPAPDRHLTVPASPQALRDVKDKD